MQKIAGFFTNHTPKSVNVLPLIITETEKTFAEDCNCRIVIRENTGFDPVRAQEVFQRSLNEIDLLKLLLESEYKSEKEREAFRKLYTPKAKALYLQNEDNYSLFLLNELAKLRSKMQFQLLEESGTTRQIDSLSDQLQQAIREEQIAIMQGKRDKAEYLSIQGEIILYQQSRLRDALVQNTVDKLLEQYSDLCLQIIFGKQHWVLLDPYLNQKNLEVLVVVHNEPGDFVSDSIFAKIKNGREGFSDQEKQLSVIYDCITMTDDMLRKNAPTRNLMLHRGKLLEAALSGFSEEYYQKLVYTHGNILSKTLAFLENTGTFDKLQREYPASINFYKDLYQKSRNLINVVPIPQEQSASAKVGRNNPCPCGSGKKYKKCCGR